MTMFLFLPQIKINKFDIDRTNKTFVHKIVNIFLPIIFNICFGCSKEPSHWDSSFECPHMFYLIRLFTPINNFSVMLGWVLLGWTSTKQGFMRLAQGHNAVTLVRLEPATPRSPVKHSTTKPLHSSATCFGWEIWKIIMNCPLLWKFSRGLIKLYVDDMFTIHNKRFNLLSMKKGWHLFVIMLISMVYNSWKWTKYETYATAQVSYFVHLLRV